MSVGLPEAQIRPYLSSLATRTSQLDITIGCINSPQNITLSGSESHIDALKVMLDRDQVFARKLRVEIAYHSSHMDEFAEDYANMIGDLEKGDCPPKALGTKMISTVTGEKASAEILCSAKYWVTNLTSPVQFSQALTLVCSGAGKRLRKKIDGSHRDATHVHDLLELGPHSALQGPVRDIIKSLGRTSDITYQSAMRRQRSDTEVLLEAVGRLHCIGHDLDITSANRRDANHSDHPMVLTNLPEYQFDHSRILWTESRLSTAFRFRAQPRLDLLGTPDPDWNPNEAKWRHTIRLSELPWVEDHKVENPVQASSLT